MAADQSTPVTEPVSADGGPTETISQFVARVLDQLSLSAWLPAAALLLLLDFIVQLGVALDAKGEGPGLGNWRCSDPDERDWHRRRRAAGDRSSGRHDLDASFFFRSDQRLEGYWGTTDAVESIARWRASRHRGHKGKLDRRRRKLTEDAWAVAKAKIIEMEDGRRQNGLRPDLTPIMIGRLEARVLKTFPVGRLTPKQLERVRRYDWAAPSAELRLAAAKGESRQANERFPQARAHSSDEAKATSCAHMRIRSSTEAVRAFHPGCLR